MRPGKSPTPIELKLVKGTASNHKTEKSVMAVEVIAPECPCHLNVHAKNEWYRIMPHLLRLKIVSELDTVALALYCQAYGRWKSSEEIIQK